MDSASILGPFCACRQCDEARRSRVELIRDVNNLNAAHGQLIARLGMAKVHASDLLLVLAPPADATEREAA